MLFLYKYNNRRLEKMEPNTKTVTESALETLDYWKQIPVDDIVPLRLSQKIDSSINSFVGFFNNVVGENDVALNPYQSYVWSISIRDFSILLRDTILASTKYEQLLKDGKLSESDYLYEMQKTLQHAAQSVSQDYNETEDNKLRLDVIRHQQSPVQVVIDQLLELQKQAKKIFRSSDKIDDVRFNISEYVKDFQLQYSRQISAAEKLFVLVEEVREVVKSISEDTSEVEIETIVNKIGDCSQKLELIQGTESIEILPYANKETLAIPVSTSNGKLNYKSINIKSEFARWFSSFIYPKVVELESKRDHAVEKCLFLFSQIRTKIAAISLSDVEIPKDFQKDFDSAFSALEKDALSGLRMEIDDMNAMVADYQSNFLVASNIYSEEFLFLPESGSAQISNLGKDAQKRIASRYSEYSNSITKYVNKILSRYVEIDKTPYSHYVNNKLSIYDEDDSMALFLKNGYLGKSFTIPRPDVLSKVIDDYKLWQEGFAGAILLSGNTGSGKSTVLGMINHLGLNEEIIQLKTRESYFIEHRSYEPVFDLKKLIEQVLKKTRGRKIIISVDDLGHWHNSENELFENINKLFEAIVKYRKRVFFIISSSPFLKERIQLFKDINSVFSSQIDMGKMTAAQIRNALSLRAKVNEKFLIEGTEFETRIGNVIRESKGNVGYAMLEYCRYYNDAYRPNVKSQEFKELVKSYHTFLSYLSVYQICSVKRLSDFLSELDFRDTIRSIDHLVGQKILIRPKNGYIGINPLLVHTIELTLLKSGN